MTREELQQDFHNYLGESWSNSQGKINIYYVMWLENKVLRREVAEMPTEEAEIKTINDFLDFADPIYWGENEYTDYRQIIDLWFRNRMSKPNTGGEG